MPPDRKGFLTVTGYFDCLADVLPADVIDAMHNACAHAIHRGMGRDGEPAVMAGVRALIGAMMLRAEHDRLLEAHVASERYWAAEAREAPRKAAEAVQERLAVLDAVCGLVDVRRKTVSMDALRDALGIVR